MTVQELREEISIELEYLETVVHELNMLRGDLGSRMQEGVFRIDAVFYSFEESLNKYLFELVQQ